MPRTVPKIVACSPITSSKQRTTTAIVTVRAMRMGPLGSQRAPCQQERLERLSSAEAFEN